MFGYGTSDWDNGCQIDIFSLFCMLVTDKGDGIRGTVGRRKKRVDAFSSSVASKRWVSFSFSFFCLCLNIPIEMEGVKFNVRPSQCAPGHVFFFDPFDVEVQAHVKSTMLYQAVASYRNEIIVLPTILKSPFVHLSKSVSL